VPVPAARRFQFKVDPKTPLKELMPKPPKTGTRKPFLPDTLAQVPEVTFQEPLQGSLAPDQGFQETAKQIAKINHLNSEKPDHFMHVLLEDRADLRGLPFLLGDACRTRGESSRQFTRAVQLIRSSASGALAPTNMTDDQADQVWLSFRSCCDRADREPAAGESGKDHASPARVAAMVQMFPPASAKVRLGMVKHLAGVSHVEATRALARLAIFSPEEEVRRAAISALQVRRERDYTEILMAGFHYPWPEVPKRAAEAVIRLDRKDLAGRLVDILDEPDPRAPQSSKVKGKPVTVVRELVRINHHRNCLLCHAPGSPEKVSPDITLGAVPIPGEPLPTPDAGYHSNSPDVQVRIDVTYLRQDFSILQAVADAHPWPQMQRFDFLVRTRAVSDEEASEYQQLLKREPGVLPPNHRAALQALRELTGKDAAPTAKAWRELLRFSER
jgi:hypothetical protein